MTIALFPPTESEGKFSNTTGKCRSYLSYLIFLLSTIKVKNSKPFYFSNSTCIPVFPESKRESITVYAWPQGNIKKILKYWVRSEWKL